MNLGLGQFSSGASAYKRGNGSVGQFSSWDYQRRIDIDNTKVPSAQVNFPVLITEAQLPSNIFTVDTTGGSLRFTSDFHGNNWSNLEIVLWDTVGSKALLWVKVPTLAAATDTPIFLFYGKTGATQPAAGATGGSQGVWSNSYEAVYHMQDATTSTVADSTGNGRTGTKFAANEPVEATGKVGQGQSFDGANDEITATGWKGIGGTNPKSVEAWVKTNVTPAFQSVVTWGTNAAAQRLAWGTQDPGAGVSYNSFDCNGGRRRGSVDLADNAWHYICMNASDTMAGAKLFEAGVEETYSNFIGNVLNTGNTQDVKIGYGTIGASGYWTGMIDEVRISSALRDANWFTICYNNQNNPATFASLNPITPP